MAVMDSDEELKAVWSLRLEGNTVYSECCVGPQRTFVSVSRPLRPWNPSQRVPDCPQVKLSKYF